MTLPRVPGPTVGIERLRLQPCGIAGEIDRHAHLFSAPIASCRPIDGFGWQMVLSALSGFARDPTEDSGRIV